MSCLVLSCLSSSNSFFIKWCFASIKHHFFIVCLEGLDGLEGLEGQVRSDRSCQSSPAKTSTRAAGIWVLRPGPARAGFTCHERRGPSPWTQNRSPAHPSGFRLRLLTHLRRNLFSITFFNTFGFDFSSIFEPNFGPKINQN